MFFSKPNTSLAPLPSFGPTFYAWPLRHLMIRLKLPADPTFKLFTKLWESFHAWRPAKMYQTYRKRCRIGQAVEATPVYMCVCNYSNLNLVFSLLSSVWTCWTCLSCWWLFQMICKPMSRQWRKLSGLSFKGKIGGSKPRPSNVNKLL